MNEEPEAVQYGWTLSLRIILRKGTYSTTVARHFHIAGCSSVTEQEYELFPPDISRGAGCVMPPGHLPLKNLVDVNFASLNLSKTPNE